LGTEEVVALNLVGVRMRCMAAAAAAAAVFGHHIAHPEGRNDYVNWT
jgi:hypothetical protein